jgi:ribokinase
MSADRLFIDKDNSMIMFDVIGFGALNIDELFKVNKIAGKDDESFVTYYQESCGGSAANTVVGLSRLGLKTGFIGKVANDREGQLLLESFRRENVDTEGIVVAKKGRSGVVMGFVDREGERALYVAPGVNVLIDPREINEIYMKNAKLLHLTSFVSDTSFESQKTLLRQIPKNITISFDPGMLYAKRGLLALKPIIERVSIVLPNSVELRFLTEKNYEDGSKELIDMGVEVVGVKLGKKGCYVTNGKESHTVKPFNARVVDTTGAGDAWNAGFLYSFSNGKSLKECGESGNFVASRCVMKMGARKGLPSITDYRNQLSHN